MRESDFQYAQWPVYQDAKAFACFCCDVVAKMPREYRFELGSQIIRASISVTLNIAEGAGKRTAREFNRYLNISRGSLFETIAALDVMKDLKLLDPKAFLEAVRMSRGVSHQIEAMKGKIRREQD